MKKTKETCFKSVCKTYHNLIKNNMSKQPQKSVQNRFETFYKSVKKQTTEN